MPTVLLRPQILTFKNRLKSEFRRRTFNRDLLLLFVSIALCCSVFFGTKSFLVRMLQHPDFSIEAASHLLHMSLFAFFLLLLFSSSIAALGYLFSAKDLPLLLTAPISRKRLYYSRLLAITGNASWMFFLFGAPAVAAYGAALNLAPTFYFVAALTFIPFAFIPSILGTVVITLFVNIIPPHRLRDVLVIFAFFMVCIILILGQDSTAYVSTEEQKLADLMEFLKQQQSPDPIWSPSRWIFEVLNGFITGAHSSILYFSVLLTGGFAALLYFGGWLFDRLFLRGWSIAIQGERTLRVRRSSVSTMLGRFIVPFNSQFRAICFKEARMFFRDTTQSLQMLMLLMLTFVYLFNFRTLRSGSQFSEETFAWWHVILSLANVAFGACVIAAITTRFVFPAVSLEGRAYSIVRGAPLSIEQLLRYKFRAWIIPISILALILLVSGTWAIQAPVAAIVATAIIALSISGGIVGLGIGIGAVYARFDWDSPAQVTASFGSLVFMLLAICCVMLTSIPALFIFILTCVPSFSVMLDRSNYLLALGFSYFLVFTINYGVARKALAAGTQRLRDMEN